MEQLPGHMKREETGSAPAESGFNGFTKCGACKAAGLRRRAASQRPGAPSGQRRSGRPGSGGDVLRVDGKHVG